MQVLLLITVITIIPYALWKFTHQFMGVLTLLASLHFIWIPKPFDVLSPFGLYMVSFCLLALYAYGATLINGLGRKRTYPYQVASIQEQGRYLQVALEPTRDLVPFRAGQFAFISFDHPDLKESHPFSFSAAPNDSGNIRFSIKMAGDGTQALRQHLNVGTTALVSKGYGYFGRYLPSVKSQRDTLWIASGIGITPFMALAQSLSQQSGQATGSATLMYCVRNQESALHLAELQQIADNQSRFHLILVESSVTGRLTLESLSPLIEKDISQYEVYFCGPSTMRRSLQKSACRAGLPRRRFHYEVFEIRSGIGLTPLVSWGLRKLTARFPVLEQLWDFVEMHLLTKLPMT